ncbi:MAG: hypothetical protein FWG66_00365 [Spirochaetes bacterium]|nr:hypothetical protein [Spirochaetota bacterium]
MLIAIYCVAFLFLVAVQFSGQGNFSIQVGLMQIRGQSPQPPEVGSGLVYPLNGGLRLFFGGLEFNLANENLRGMLFVDAAGNQVPVSPQSMLLPPASGGSTHASFIIPGGTSLTFTTQNDGDSPYLQIEAAFAGGVSQISLPFRTRHSLIVSEGGQLGLTFDGNHYFFSAQSQVDETRRLVFSAGNTVAFYGVFTEQAGFGFTPALDGTADFEEFAEPEILLIIEEPAILPAADTAATAGALVSEDELLEDDDED